jgi:hypothetical protein
MQKHLNVCKIFSLLLLITCANCVIAQQSDKVILLKKVKVIPLPDTTRLVAPFYVINELPQIIAVIHYGNINVKGAVIATSRLKKGKVMVWGSSAYFENALLKQPSVKQLIRNTVGWAVGNRKPVIGLLNNADKEFKSFLKTQSYTVHNLVDLNVLKRINVLFVTEEIKSNVQLKALEDFVNNGGTLIYALPTLKKASAAPNELTVNTLSGMNALLVKAGIYFSNVLIRPTLTNKALYTDSIPAYLRINTLVALNTYPKGETWDEYYLINYGITPTIENTLIFNQLSSPVIKNLRKQLDIPVEGIIPTPAQPVDIKSGRQKMQYLISYYLMGKELNIKANHAAVRPGSKVFPGEVTGGALNIDSTITIPVKVGTQGLSDPASVYHRPHSTGLYVPAGTTVQISVQPQYLSQQLKAQVGVHNDDLKHMDNLIRDGFDLTRTFDLNKPVTEVYSPYGGLLMIKIADTTTLKNIAIKVKGAVKAPYFKLGETSEKEWVASIRNYPAPWAELATDKIVLTVPSYRIRQLSNPRQLMQFWDEVMDADANLAVIADKRVHLERIIVDSEVAFGYMFTAEDKIVVPDDESCALMLDESLMRKNGSWGHFHELGHRHQFNDFDFGGLGEVTVNLYTMYVYDKVLKKGIYNHENIADKETVNKRIMTYLNNKPSFEKWSNDPFTALCMYVQLIEEFGWNPIKAVHAKYRSIPKEQYAQRSEQDKIDLWFTSICAATYSNLTQFFETWKIPVSYWAKQQAVAYKPWGPALFNNQSILNK